MNDLFLQMVPNLSAAPSLTNLVRSKSGVGSSLARPCLEVNFRRLLDIGVEGWVALDLRITKWRTRAEWLKGCHSQARKKKSEISADFSVFGGNGKNRLKKFRRKIEKFRHFPEKIRFFPKFGINSILGH